MTDTANHIKQAVSDLIDDLFVIDRTRVCVLPDSEEEVERIERLIEIRIEQAIAVTVRQ